jgi:large exoprotein involved in heme utilization and adhesion
MRIEKDLRLAVVSKNNLAKTGHLYKFINISSSTCLRASCCLLACLLAVMPPISLAAPTGGNITGGSGAINQSGSTTNIYQNSNTLSINWNSFNVNSNETVNFLQPGASSIGIKGQVFEL